MKFLHLFYCLLELLLYHEAASTPRIAGLELFKAKRLLCGLETVIGHRMSLKCSSEKEAILCSSMSFTRQPSAHHLYPSRQPLHKHRRAPDYSNNV